MTNAEMVALVAEKAMGHEIRMLGVYQEPECGEWCVCLACQDDNFGPNEAFEGSEEERHRHEREWPCYQERSPDWWEPEPNYPEDIAAAWQVVERLQRDGFWCEIAVFDPGDANCDFYRHAAHDEVHYDVDAVFPALAICLAALKANGVEVPA